MKYSRSDDELEITLTPAAPAEGAVVLLHGLGADGWDLLPVVEALGIPDALPLRFILPHAPVRPVTVSGGYEMPAWCDVRDITPEDRVDPDGLAETARRIHRYLEREQRRGLPASRLLLAGFSQGGAVALHVGLRHPQRLAGIVALSTFLPFPDTLAGEQALANADVPVLMCHGIEDPIVPVQLGRDASGLLSRMAHPVEWHEYPMGHEICAEEIAVMSRWIQEHLTAAL